MAVKYLVAANGQDHLPYTDENGKPDHRLMGAAWAALHGGYRGNEYEGPNKAETISRLTAIYKSEGMDTPGSSSEHADFGGQWMIVSIVLDNRPLRVGMQQTQQSADAHKSRRFEKWWDTRQVVAGVIVLLLAWLKDWLVPLFGLWWKHWHH